MSYLCPLHTFSPYHIKISGKQVSYVMNLQRYHCHPVEAEAPCYNRDIYSKRDRDLRPEYSCASKLHPAELRVFNMKLYRRLCKRKICRQEFYLFCPGNLQSK